MLAPDAEPASLALRSVRPEFLRNLRNLADRHRPVRFTWNARPVALRLVAEEPGPDPRPEGTWIARLAIDGRTVAVGIERLPDISRLSANLAGIELDGLPGELAAGVLEVCFEEALEQLDRHGIDVSLQALERGEGNAPASGESVAWHIDRDGEAAWMRGRLWGDDASLEHLAALVARVPAEPLRDGGGLTARLDLRIGRLVLTRSTLAGVEVDDLLLAELGSYPINGRCELLLNGRPTATATIMENNVSIEEMNPDPAPDASGIPPAPDAMAGAEAPLGPVDLGELETELTFLVGRESVTFDTLRTLQRGATFALSTPMRDAVTICADGRPVGRGELLEVGERIGIRVTEWTLK